MSVNLPRLLIIDDQPDSVGLLVRFLADRAVEIMVALDGPDGLEKAVAGRPDLILLDLIMAGMDGLEVCQKLKSDPRTAVVPVIFLSASTAIEDKLKGFALGAVDYITKPFSEDEVLARVFIHLHTSWQMARLQTMVGQRALERAGDQAFPDDHLFAQALALLEKRMSDPPGLIELAGKLGTNERKLTDVFRQRVGMTVFDYFSELRLETARHLLESSRMKVQAIASHVGYRNAGDFTRAYRRRYGLSPREYRQASGGRAGDED
ncbi:MAG TPA: response regulator [Rhodocyclaceae bacterium]|nr:response regulator [Rhodocyclaceae bacterium]